MVLSLAAMGQRVDNFKNLAGTADEMDSLRLPDVATLGVRSRAAMLPVRFRDGKAVLDIPVESTENLRLALMAPNSGSWGIIATNDLHKDLDLRSGSELVERRDGEVGLDGVNFPGEVFSFDNVKAGTWRVEITAPKNAAPGEGKTAGYLVVTTESPYQVYSYVDTRRTLAGRNIRIVASVFDQTAAGDETRPEPVERVIRKIEGEIRRPDGATGKLRFEAGDDGIFAGTFTPLAAGEYNIQITVEGTAPNGEDFVRTSEQVVQVLGDNARFGRSAHTNLVDDTRLQINLPTPGLGSGRKVIVYGEIWGRDPDGLERPIAWVGGMSVAEGAGLRANLPMILDGRWLGRSDAKDGFELRNVRIQDADYFVTLAESSRIPLTITAMPDNARGFSGEITDEMRMGKRPESEPVENAVGGKLMLVHGYCSGGNPFPTSQFANNIVFSDPNRNRTHDQFANLIRNFGASYPSFGIVAHSQGGAASLHLYTYYWSGLDYATGTRLIQSVGTPYQGTALAGNLALLGQIFGAGCGTNYDLTYSGSASWLAGIPGWARAKVYYSTTSFTDVWWAYDYCSLATDLFLSDPDDGVVEKAYAQLSGANNRGHKTGWCHTSGMRDPAQTTDSSRNADMNANAAR